MFLLFFNTKQINALFLVCHNLNIIMGYPKCVTENKIVDGRLLMDLLIRALQSLFLEFYSSTRSVFPLDHFHNLFMHIFLFFFSQIKSKFTGTYAGYGVLFVLESCFGELAVAHSDLCYK